MKLCDNCGEPIENEENFCANCGSAIHQESNTSQKDRFYPNTEEEITGQDLIDSLNPLDENEVYRGPEDILLSKKNVFKTKATNKRNKDQEFFDSLEPLDESEVYESSEDDITPRSLLIDNEKSRSRTIKSLKKRTFSLTMVLVINYLIIGFLGVFSIYEIVHDLMVSSILFIFIGYAVLLVKWVQDFDNKARFILLAFVSLELIGSIFYANIIILVLAFFQIYVLLLDRRTVELFKTTS